MYFPPPAAAGAAAWETVDPAAAGFDPDRLRAAVQFSLDHETDYSEPGADMAAFLLSGGMHGNPEPPGLRDIVGPTVPRGKTNGLILKAGRIVAEWGDTTEQVDMTFSATKSYLATMVGLAWGDQKIASLDDKVGLLVADGGFEPPHNSEITWRHFLHQASEWTGTLFTKPDSVDHNRGVNTGSGGGDTAAAKGTERELKAPGSFYEYNDVRVNRCSLAALRVHGAPLPEVLKQRIMDPIGASDSWRWHGYSTSFVTLGGQQGPGGQGGAREVQSVSGGGHWGGGLFISSRDHARFGLLHCAGGVWGAGGPDAQQLLPDGWLEVVTAPSPTNHQYGAMWWLNAPGEKGPLYPACPPTSYSAQGAGGNCIWVEPTLELVVVVRWCGDFKGLTEKVMAALADASPPPANAGTRL
eukprot:SAG22_NODE_735_length_7542_cov_11.695956_2_plen_412_part_00